jgi:hypothetical protein
MMIESSAATLIVPASRLAVVCNYETHSVLQELVVVSPATAHDGTGGGGDGGSFLSDDVLISNDNNNASWTMDWGGMAGGALESCDDWDLHQVVVDSSSSPELPSQIYSGNSVTRAVTSEAGASSSANPMSGGFGFAVWLTLPNNSSTNGLGGDGTDEEEAPVLTLGRPGNALSDDVAVAMPKWKECGELYDLELSYRPAFREFVLRYSDADGSTIVGAENVTTRHDQASHHICRTLRIGVDDVLGPASTTSNDTDTETYASTSTLHLAVMWTAQPPTLNVYGQGRTVLETPLPQALDVTLSQWNADEDHLVLFREGSFGGGLHQTDFFLAPNVPNSDQIATLYQQGFVKAQYHLLNNRTGSNKDENAWVQLDPLQAPADASRRIAQDATTSLKLPLGGMVRWKRNMSDFHSSVSSLPVDDAALGRRFGLWVNITRLPTHGKLSISNSSSIINRVDSVLVLPLPIEQVSAATLELDYTVTGREFYNLPARKGSILDDSERLEATISVIWKGESIASSPVVIPIQVQQVNSHPPVLTAPASLIVTLPNSSFLLNVSLYDPDFGSDLTPVRVDVSSQHSSLTLALNGDDELSFVYNECRQRSESPWQCVGGEREGAMAGRVVTFVAPMKTVTRILSTKVRVNLVHESDTISIRVYDGQDDMNCLSAREHAMYGSNWTLHRGCFTVNADVELVADPLSAKTGAAAGGVPDTSSISRVANLLFWSLTLLLVVGIMACLRRCMPRCLARGSCFRRGAIDADDGVDTPRGENSDVSSPDGRNRKVKDVENGSPETLDTTISDDEFDDVASF